jgi:hypothetical protein
MIGNYFARLTGSKRNLLALLASSAILTAGCANMSSTAPTGANPFNSPATLTGKIQGGNQPVTGAIVTLWYAGQSGAATKAATTTSDSLGSFVFTKDTANGNPADNGSTSTYSCPTGTDPLVYVMSKGGNTQNNGSATPTNSAAAFVAIYGDCSVINASSFVFMSEVTTVATMAAAVQFFDPVLEAFTADGTGQQKRIMDNLPNTIALLANSTTGLSVPSTTISPQTGPGPTGIQPNIALGVTVTATPEPGKINLLANIISACVNSPTSSGAGCTSLFSAAASPFPNTTSFNPGSFAPATDTLQALYFILTNPTNTNSTNLGTLFGLAGGAGAPYQPSASQPTDWTIGINYTSTSSCGTALGGSGGFIGSPVDINIDAVDNVWIANSQTGGNLSGINAAGAPLACINLDAGASSGGGTVDSLGNIWFGAGTTMYRYNPITKTPVAFPVTVHPLGITADGLGTVYFTAVSGTTGSLYGLFGAASAPVAVTPTPISTTVGPNPMRLMPDFKANNTAGNIWVSSGSTFVSQVAPTSSTGGGVLNGFLTTPFSVSGNSYGLSVDRSNGIFSSSIDSGVINRLAFNGGTWIVPNGWPFTAAASAGISSPTALSVDARSNAWIPNNANGASTGSVSAVTVDSTALSSTTGFQKANTYLHSGRALAIDQAGNVWVAGDGNNFVTEFVGGAVPLYQPYSAGLGNGRFQSIP